MTRRAFSFARSGFSPLLLLTFIPALLMYITLVLQNNPVGQQPCDEGPLQTYFKNDAKRKYEAYRPPGQVQEEADQVPAESDRAIHAKDERIMELERQLSQVTADLKTATVYNQYPMVDRADDGLRPLRVTVAHHPRSDMLGSFTLPSIFLLAITHRWGWEMEILPYKESSGQKLLNHAFAKGSKLGKSGDGTGLQDANYRTDYNPVELNSKAHANLGFFPEQPFPAAANMSEWMEVKPLPAPGTLSLHKACRKTPIIEANGYVRCRLILPPGVDTGPLLKHILAHGTLENFLTADLRKLMRERFMEANVHRLTYFSASNSTGNYNVAIHVRRGDVNKKDYPDRWTEQSVYASIARHICRTHPLANIHIFSSGKNEEGWTTLEQVSDSCGSVSFHLDEDEFDAWAHFVAADALVTSRSTFSYVPAILSGGEIYAPEWGHAPLEHWRSFRNEDGKLKRP